MSKKLIKNSERYVDVEKLRIITSNLQKFKNSDQYLNSEDKEEILEEWKNKNKIIFSIDIKQLEIALVSLIKDSERCNKGNRTAGRRFRVNTKALEKIFLEVRKITPKFKKKKKNA